MEKSLQSGGGGVAGGGLDRVGRVTVNTTFFFFRLSQIIVGANVFTGTLTNSKFTRLVVKKYQ